jgi:NADPH2:quinone reductase
VSGFTLYGLAPEQLAAGLRALIEAYAAGRLRLTVGYRVPLAEAAAAHRVMAARQTTGKVVLTVE